MIACGQFKNLNLVCRSKQQRALCVLHAGTPDGIYQGTAVSCEIVLQLGVSSSGVALSLHKMSPKHLILASGSSLNCRGVSPLIQYSFFCHNAHCEEHQLCNYLPCLPSVWDTSEEYPRRETLPRTQDNDSSLPTWQLYPARVSRTSKQLL